MNKEKGAIDDHVYRSSPDNNTNEQTDKSTEMNIKLNNRKQGKFIRRNAVVEGNMSDNLKKRIIELQQQNLAKDTQDAANSLDSLNISDQ